MKIRREAKKRKNAHSSGARFFGLAIFAIKLGKNAQKMIEKV